jgi:hypothetical protein
MTPTPIDATDPKTAHRLVEIQRAAYAVETELIGFDGIPTLHDAVDDVMTHDLQWLGVRHRHNVRIRPVLRATRRR